MTTLESEGPVVLAQSGMPSPDLLLVVVLTAQPETVHEFRAGNERRTFGRASACDIVVPDARGDRALSRVAGVLWRMEDELWLRNLSTRHELYVEVPGRQADPPLPPRRDDGLDRGPARSIPAGLAYVRGPGGCELLVRQLRPAEPSRPRDDEDRTDGGADNEATLRAPDLPDDLRPVAVELCAPLLAGGRLPASYSQIAEALGLTSKSVRLQVGKLCRLYAEALPELRDRIEARRAAESEQLGVGADWRLSGGIWIFDGVDEPAERQRVRALALPDYFEVAHLLVRRGIVNTQDV